MVNDVLPPATPEPDTNPAATPLTDKAVAQLRRLGEGNGLSAADITLLKTDERMLLLEAEMTLRPSFETSSQTYPGKIKNKTARVMPSPQAMREEMANLKRTAQEDPAKLLQKALTDIRAQPGEGWGLDDAKVTVPDMAVTLASTATCVDCRGQGHVACATCSAQGYVTCPQCGQRVGEELCFVCGGSGVSHGTANDRCFECQGTGWAPCRQCVKAGHPRGFVPCPQCNGKRGVACTSCRSTGLLCEEVTLLPTVDIQFRLRSSGLPSVVNRTLSRLGLIKLGKGHADIETYTPTEDEEFALKQGRAQGSPPPALYYRARLPFADVRVSIKGKPAQVASFGKRGVIVQAPDFLDDALTLARDHLQQASRGQVPLESAMQARAIRDAVALNLAGQGGVKDFRRLYPVGLSAKVATEIVGYTRFAINRATLKLRMLLALGIFGLAAGLLAGFALTPLRARLMAGLTPYTAMMLDGALVGLIILLGWGGMSLGLRLGLKRRFPQYKHATIPKIGKTGLGLLGSLLVLGVGVNILAKPLWLKALFH